MSGPFQIVPTKKESTLKLKYSEGYIESTSQKILYVYGVVKPGITQQEVLSVVRENVEGEALVEYDRGHYYLIGWRLGKKTILIVSVNVEPFVLVSIQGESVNQMKRIVQNLFIQCDWIGSNRRFPTNMIRPVEGILDRVDSALNN